MLYTLKKAYSIEFFNCCKITTKCNKTHEFIEKMRNTSKKSLKIKHY